MKVALCLSGNLRNFKDTHYSFEKYLLYQYDVDVFFYGCENKEGIHANENDLRELYSPKSYVINNPEHYASMNVSEKYHSAHGGANPIYAFYNIYKSNELKKQYEEKHGFTYDLVFRCRTDYFWFRSLSDDELNLAKTNVLTPEEWSFKCVNPFARSDVFAVGSSSLMDQYSSIYCRVDEYCRTINFHGESVCGYHLMVNNIPNIETKRCIVFEYPCKRLEKYIHPYTYFRYFDDIPDIENEQELGRVLCNKRRDF